MGKCMSKQSLDDYVSQKTSIDRSSSIVSRKESGRRATASTEAGSRNFNGLKDSEVHMIRKSWRVVMAKEPKFPQLLFADVFRTHPELKNSFQLEHMPEEQMLAHPRFISHAANFQNFFQTIYDHLSNEEKLVETAVFIGTQHAHMKIRDPDIFESSYWILIARRALDIILTNSEEWVKSRAESQGPISLETLDHLWQMVLLRVILEMNIAFYDTLLRSSTAATRFLQDPPGTGSTKLSASRTTVNDRQQPSEPPNTPTGRGVPVPLQSQNGTHCSRLRGQGSVGSGSEHDHSALPASPMNHGRLMQRSASTRPAKTNPRASLATSTVRELYTSRQGGII